MNTTVTATTCGLCGSAIWKQTAPFVYRADTTPLRSATEELQMRLWGRRTYQAFKIGATFELVPRHTWHLDGDYTHKIVLPDHACHRLTVDTHPEYWPTMRKASHDLPDF